MSDQVTDAVIAALQNNEDKHHLCQYIAQTTDHYETEVQTDRAVGQRIRRTHGSWVAGELAQLVDWVAVGRFYREDTKDM